MGPIAPKRRLRGADDRALMQHLLERDVAALEALYDRHASILYALLLRMLSSAAEAEEILHEVYWRVWSRPEQYQPERASPRVYLFQLARSRALDRLRRDRRRRDLLGESGSALWGDETANAQTDPFGSAVSAEDQDRVQRALSELPDPQRRAVVLSYYDGLSHREIAEALGEPLGTVKTRIRGGLARMRARLERSGGNATATK